MLGSELWQVLIVCSRNSVGGGGGGRGKREGEIERLLKGIILNYQIKYNEKV